MLIVSTILAICVVYVVFKLWNYRKLDYWEKRGVESPKASLIFGNIWEMMTGKKAMGEIYAEIYKQYKHLPWVGVYNWRNPFLMLCHPDLVRDIMVKEFNHFHDNIMESNDKTDPLLSRNPFVLKGDKWKETRTQLVPAFTSTKVKAVLPNVKIVAKRMVNYIRNNIDKTFELKELTTRFTTDNVFSIMYSMDSESFVEEKAHYWKMVRSIFVPSVSLTIRTTLMFFVPWLSNLLRLGFFPRSMTSALLKISSDTIKHRKENNLILNDMLTTFSELKSKKTGLNFSSFEIASHSAGFIADGLETSATSLSYALYEVAANPDVQERLYEEIKATIDTYGDDLSYENIQDMSYLDCVCSESLRLHPAGFFLTRSCTEEITLTSPYNENDKLFIERDTPVILPIYYFHMDPKYFPKPDIFDPDRFASENRSKIIRGSYLPFGDGPRICLGQKFGLIQMKLGLISILKDFKVTTNEKTITPLEIDPLYFIITAKGGLWVDFKERCDK
nr:cytochrome P450 monooxygenase CYP347AD2 [Lasioderma serricorne]